MACGRMQKAFDHRTWAVCAHQTRSREGISMVVTLEFGEMGVEEKVFFFFFFSQEQEKAE